MPIVLDRFCVPDSDAIAAIGYRSSYGVVVKYKRPACPSGGSEYILPNATFDDYLTVLGSPSAGGAVADLKARKNVVFFLVQEGTHFPTQDVRKWDQPLPKDRESAKQLFERLFAPENKTNGSCSR